MRCFCVCLIQTSILKRFFLLSCELAQRASMLTKRFYKTLFPILTPSEHLKVHEFT